jgi:transcriptional regulator with XRE-family HTH domain
MKGAAMPSASVDKGERRIDTAERSAAVLTNAYLRAGEKLGMTGRNLAEVLGTSEATISRMKRGRGSFLTAGTKARELALLFVRIFRSLDAILGGNTAQSRAWFHAHNHHLGRPPIELVSTVEGIIDVVRYLDAMRSRV